MPHIEESKPVAKEGDNEISEEYSGEVDLIFHGGFEPAPSR
jgi:hypothetical protein